MGNTADLIDEDEDPSMWKGSNTSSDITSPASNESSPADARVKNKSSQVNQKTSPEQHSHARAGPGKDDTATNQMATKTESAAVRFRASSEGPMRNDASEGTKAYVGTGSARPDNGT